MSDTLKNVGELADLVIGSGSAFAQLTSTTTDDTVIAVIAGLRSLVGVLEGGAQGGLTVAECKDAIAELVDRQASNAAGADAIVAARRAAADQDDGS